MCQSQIFCNGPILEAVAKYNVFKDSKEYVDRPLAKSEAEILAEFRREFGENGQNLDENRRENLRDFLEKNFQTPGTELISYVPDDWQAHPKTLDFIRDKKYRKWAKDLNRIWKQLCKEVNRSIAANPDRYSLLYVPYHFIIPGGRFREYYNWDSLWVVKGLLATEMFATAKAMIKNFAYLINEYGFVPNGGRVYYLSRSQPPVFAQMINEYLKETGDRDFLISLLPTMEKELTFWSKERSIIYDTTENSGKRSVLFQYKVKTNVPRPESYREDVEKAQSLPKKRRSQFYTEIASAAESGWDFSSRFFDQNSNDLASIRTSRILPVDLNAFMCVNYKIISEAFELNGQYAKSNIYKNLYRNMRDAMMNVFYNETMGAWFDIDLDTKSHNLNFYTSNLSPLFADCYEFEDSTIGNQKILNYFMKSGAAKFPDGIPTSLRFTNQQWDFPNGWPNAQHMIIEGFENSGDPKLQKLAYQIADAWLKNNYGIFARTGFMFEKFDVTGASQAGSGGEYDVQVGFAWSNGVVLDLLRKYGHALHYPKTEKLPPMAAYHLSTKNWKYNSPVG
uniref:Trehalase n=1 Tax=Romanomermis culicivorax TaxID=13658 RepID=A0A915J761_ROMCU